jgi:Transmembrane secretion effector
VKIFLVHSWAEHLRQHERQTKANCELEEQVYSYVEAEPESAIFECCKLANRKIRSSLRRVRHTRQSLQYGASPCCSPTVAGPSAMKRAEYGELSSVQVFRRPLG